MIMAFQGGELADAGALGEHLHPRVAAGVFVRLHVADRGALRQDR